MPSHICVICNSTFDSSFALSIHFDRCLEEDTRNALANFRSENVANTQMSDVEMDEPTVTLDEEQPETSR